LIEIDDSGTGDLVGSAFIGVYRKETGQIFFRAIPVELFYEEPWKNKAPLKKTLSIVKEAINELNIKPNELIKLCTGNIFDKVRDYFIEIDQNFEDAKIEGNLQELVEMKYINHLRNLGVKSRNLTIESGKKRYFILFDWVSRDFYKREKFVKTGFKKWRTIWRDRAIERYEEYQNKKRNRTKN
jgi:hypothetical protein